MQVRIAGIEVNKKSLGVIYILVGVIVLVVIVK